MLYSNPLRDIITLKNGFILSDFIYLIYYTSFHGLAIYYFLTAGARPGFVNETEAEIDQKTLEMQRIQRQYSLNDTTEDEEDDEENIGFPIERKSDA